MTFVWPQAVTKLSLAALCLAAVSAGVAVAAAQTATTQTVASKKSVKKKAAPGKPASKRYRSSSGKSAPRSAAKKPAAKKSTPHRSAAASIAPAELPTTTGTPAFLASQAAPASVVTNVVTNVATNVVKRRALPFPRPVVSMRTRMEANEGVLEKISRGADLPVENAAALIPFFEQLYRHQKGEMPGPLRILHYGDSHAAADDWTGDMRLRFQEKFGDGGSGFSFAGRPWSGYRRFDVRTGSTRGWHTDGLVGKPGDGVYGRGGVSMSTHSAREGVYLQAECQQFELFYLQQPGGGALELYDNGAPIERIETAGDLGPGYYRYEPVPGPHKFELETLEKAPVRFFRWVAENSTGVTYETRGIDGARAPTALGWHASLLLSTLHPLNPLLILV